MKIRSINFLLILSIIITLISGAVSFYHSILKDDKVKTLLSTHEVILNTSELLSLLTDTETSQRGFLLTGEDTYLQPYREAISQIDSKFLRIKQLTGDNSLQQYKIAQLGLLIRDKNAELEQTIILYKIKRRDASVSIVKSGKGKMIMSKIRGVIKDINQIENDILVYRNQKLENAKNVTYVIMLISTIVIISITCMAFATINKNQRTNNELVNQLQYSNLKLQVKSNQLHTLNQELATQNEEIAAQSDHIESQKAALELINKELIHINEEKNSFMGIATHDLKSPVNNIKGLNEIVKYESSKLSAEAGEALKLISVTTDKMLELIKNLLDVNKIEHGDIKTEMLEIDIVQAIKEVILSFKNAAGLKQIEIVFNPEINQCLISTDMNLLSQVLENLISNAIKFSPYNKKVWINLIVAEKVKIEVIDEGPGIRENEIPRLFGRFQKLSARPTGGENSTGLGLSIAKELVKSLKGSIRYEKGATGGAGFIVELNTT